MSGITWITRAAIVRLHAESLAEHGGMEGVRDTGLLESALSRARNLHAYDGVDDIARLAAAYGFAVAQNHPFNDGNKRAAFLAIGIFLARNGYGFYAGKVDSIVRILGLAAGELGEDELASWIREYMDSRVHDGHQT